MRERVEREAQQLARRAFEGARVLGDARERGADRVAHQRFEHRFLAVEIEVDRALGDAGACGGSSGQRPFALSFPAASQNITN